MDNKKLAKKIYEIEMQDKIGMIIFFIFIALLIGVVIWINVWWWF